MNASTLDFAPSGALPPVNPAANLAAEAEILAPGRTDATEYRPLSRTELLLILGFWLLIGILTSANYLIEPRGHGPWQPLVPFAATMVTFSNSLMWCAVTPTIIWVASRLPLERTRWPTRLMFVVIGVLLAIVIDLATSSVREHLFYPATPLT